MTTTGICVRKLSELNVCYNRRILFSPIMCSVSAISTIDPECIVPTEQLYCHIYFLYNIIDFTLMDIHLVRVILQKYWNMTTRVYFHS